MEMIIDNSNGSILAKLPSAQDANDLNTRFNQLINASPSEDPLSLYAIQGDIYQFWPINEWFTVGCASKRALDHVKETIIKIAQQSNESVDIKAEANPINESVSEAVVTPEEVANQVLKLLREDHPDFITGAGASRDGEDVYVHVKLDTPKFALSENEISDYNENTICRLVSTDEGWIVMRKIDRNGDPEVQKQHLVSDASVARDFLNEKLQEGTNSWTLPVDLG